MHDPLHRRLGVYAIHWPLLQQPSTLLHISPHVVVIRVDPTGTGVDVLALSPQFDEVADGMPAPRYTCGITHDSVVFARDP